MISHSSPGCCIQYHEVAQVGKLTSLPLYCRDIAVTWIWKYCLIFFICLFEHHPLDELMDQMVRMELFVDEHEEREDEAVRAIKRRGAAKSRHVEQRADE